MYLGLDIGTSGVKALLMDNVFDVVGSAEAPLEVSRPHPGWSEQDPDAWTAASEAAIAALAKANPKAMKRLQAIGLSGQMHGAVLLDTNGKPLRPCILWNDGRSAAQCRELEEKADFRATGGNIVMAGFTAPKLRWVAQREPDIFAATAKVLLPKDYVRLWLTGDYVAEMSDAAGTLWLDVGRRSWSKDLLEATGLSLDHMPALIEGTEISGLLRGELADRWGLERIPVAGGGGDNAATACGMGILSSGTGFLSLGTSGVLFASTQRFAPNTDEAVHAFCHAVPDTWHQMGVILSAVDSLNWLAGVTGRTAPELSAMLPETIEQPSPVGFLPYLSGERTPHDDPTPAGAFLHLSRASDAADLAQAVMEGVGFAFADCASALAVAGTTVETAFAVGGGARSDQWLQIIASQTGMRLLVPKSGDLGAAFGAAKLAMACATGDASARVFSQPAVQREIRPDPHLQERYAPMREAFRKAYPAVRSLRSRDR